MGVCFLPTPLDTPILGFLKFNLKNLGTWSIKAGSFLFWTPSKRLYDIDARFKSFPSTFFNFFTKRDHRITILASPNVRKGPKPLIPSSFTIP